jgi:hypothetical protein
MLQITNWIPVIKVVILAGEILALWFLVFEGE